MSDCCSLCGSKNGIVRGSNLCFNCYISKKDSELGIKQKRKIGHEEDDIQAEFFEKATILFPKLGKLLYHACNEGKRNPKRAKRIGIKSGVADVHLAIPNKKYHSLYIEFKAGSNKQTADQIEFQKQVEAVGNKYSLCYSASEAIEILRNYINNN